MRDWQFNDRLAARQHHHTRIDHAFAFHRHQRGGLAERHAHLQTRNLTGLQFALLGQQVDAVVVVLRKPPFTGATDPHRTRGFRQMSGIVARAGHEFDFAHRVQLHAAIQTPLRIGLAAAQGAEFLCFLAVVVGVKATDDALAGAEGLLQPAHHLYRAAWQRPACSVQHHGR